MADTRPHFLTRRGLVAAGLLAVPARAFAAGPKVVTILGDSITAGLGLPAADALPSQLHLALAKLGVANTVRGAGVSGDTSADGAARVDFSVQPDTALAIVALGGNDLLQGIDPKATRANLEKIVRRLKARHMGVLVCGLSAPKEVGASYAKDFDAAFAGVAKAEGVALVPNFLAGVSRVAGLNQADSIHPNAQGVKIIAGKLAPIVARELAKRP